MTDASPAAETSSPGLLKSSAIVGLGTALSRLTGLLRTVVLAYALGKLVLADSYNLANTTPNIVYDLILGGVLSATLVPVFVDRFEHDDDDGINAVVTVVTSLLVALTVVAIIAAPLIFKAYTWAADKDAAELERAGVPLLRLFLPQIAFYGLTALGTAILNARRRFAAPAFVPVLNNLLVIGVLLWFAHDAGAARSLVDSVADHPERLWLLGAGTTGGILLMTIALWPSLRRSGWRFHWRWRPGDAAVREIVALSGWTLGYVIANQVALTIVLALAAGQAEGHVTAYLYAFQFFQLPYGLFTVSLMTTVTPELASAVSANNMASFRDQLSYGIRLMTLVILPSSIGMIVIARPLIVGLFVHGSYTTNDALLTADVLANFALGLLGFSLYLFVLRGFYALHDTRTPFFLNLLENGLNVVLAFALIGRWGAQGLAFSYSVAYMVAAIVAFAALRRRVGPIGGRGIARSTGRVAIATAVMGAVTWLVVHAVGEPTGSGAIVRLLAGVLAGIVVYGAAVLFLRVDEVDSLRKRLRRS